MNVKSASANAAVVMVSLAFGLVLCETGARLALNPGDYLSVTTRPDPVLGMTIEPNSAGLDGWGFRNSAVPSSADVVALGDSHTFGNTAMMSEAWPSVVSSETGLSVYNLGLGGYGPNQYYHLLMTRGLSLHPKHVVCALYMGDDFENAFSVTYGLDHWTSLRSGVREKVNANIWGDPEPSGSFKTVRNWLSRESMVYRLVVHGPVIGALKEGMRFKQASRNADPSVTMIDIPDKNIREAFRPIGIAARLDQNRPEVKEGMRITFHLLKEMDRACRESGCTFAVAIIPTKETVFAEYLQADPKLHLKDAVDAVIASERAARVELDGFLNAHHISYVDTLPALKQAVGDELYARTTADMHPGRNGYKVIADAVTALLRKSESRRN